VSVARFIADQRTNYRVPVVVCCAILGLSVGWFYKWIKAPVTGQARRRRDLDAAVRSLFEASDRSYGSPRIHRDLVEAGWTVGENTVADSMRRQGLFGRKPKRRRGLTKQDRAGAKFPDLVRRDFTASAPNIKWCGDMTEIPTGEGKLYLATVIRLVLEAAACLPDQRAPQRRTGRQRDQDRRGGPRRPRAHRWRHLPHRPRFDLHRRRVHDLVPRPPRHPPIDGPRRVLLRQRRRRIVLLHPRARSAVPPRLRDQGPRPRSDQDLVPRVLQHPATAQQRSAASSRCV